MKLNVEKGEELIDIVSKLGKNKSFNFGSSPFHSNGEKNIIPHEPKIKDRKPIKTQNEPTPMTITGMLNNPYMNVSQKSRPYSQ